MIVTVGPLSSQLLWNVDAAHPSCLACQHLTNLLRTELLTTGFKNEVKSSKYLLSLRRIVDPFKYAERKGRMRKTLTKGAVEEMGREDV